jgi:peptide/nickel transport system substrate-binding protein
MVDLFTPAPKDRPVVPRILGEMVPVLRRVAGVAVGLLLAFGCLTPGAAQARHPWTVPGTLRIGTHDSPNSLNPILETITVEVLLAHLMFDTLVYPLPDGTVEPDLATVVPTQANGGISADGRTITYHLRHGVHWQDGKPFTSADVAFTQAATMNPNNNVTVRQPNDRVVRLETPDPYTVVVHLARPDAPFVSEWNSVGILPAHLLAHRADLNAHAFNAAPVGTGAFRFVRWERGSKLELAANDDYFGGKPQLRSIVVSILPNETAAAIALRTHQIDWLFEPTIGAVEQVAGDPDVRIERFDAVTFQGMFLNLTRPDLADVRVRRAISLAVDRRTVVADLDRGYAVPATADIPPFMWAADPTLRVGFDPAAANALLDAAGWRRGADGIRVRDGRRLSLSYLYWSGLPNIAAIAVQVQAQLRAVGIALTLRAYDASLLFAHDGPYARGDFDLGFVQFWNYDDPEDSLFFSCAARAPAGFNYARWCDPTYERLSEAGIATVDRTRRRAIYARIQRLLVNDVPMVFLTYPVDSEAVNSDLHGFRDHDTYGRPYRWSI